MSVSYWIHPEAKTVHISYQGKISSGLVLRFFDQFESCVMQNPEFCELVDLTGVDEVQIAPDDLSHLYALIHGVYLRNACDRTISFVAPPSLVRRRIETFVDFLDAQDQAPKARIFNTTFEAITALGIPRDQRYLFLKQ